MNHPWVIDINGTLYLADGKFELRGGDTLTREYGLFTSMRVLKLQCTECGDSVSGVGRDLGEVENDFADWVYTHMRGTAGDVCRGWETSLDKTYRRVMARKSNKNRA